MKLSKFLNHKGIYGNRNKEDLLELCDDIRKYLNEYTNIHGGHIGSNLGVVELTVAILSFFDLNDSIVMFDTGHQSHVYKLLTDRYEKYNTIKKMNGISNFQETKESKYDWISNGHSGTVLAYAYSYAKTKKSKNIISIIGDASFYGSYTHVSLLNIANLKNKTITIINDNNESIGENGIKIKDLKTYSESLGFNYIYCDDGHNFDKLFECLDKVQNSKNHVILHIITKKAFKYIGANCLDNNHTISEDKKNSYQELVADILESKFDENSILLSPAMINPSLFTNIQRKYPNNVIDCGINEELCALLAAGFANQGKNVYVSVYSTFFQRMFDQLMHDIVRNDLKVTFLIDRGGLSYSGGVSHHGIYDISLLNNVKNCLIYNPFNKADILNISNVLKNPTKLKVIRYEKAKVSDLECFVSDNYKWCEIIYNKENEKTLISYGSVLNEMYDYIINKKLSINLINARFIKPLDLDLLKKHIKNKIFVYENIIEGNNLYSLIRDTKIEDMNIEGKSINLNHIGHGDKDELLDSINMNVSDYIDYINSK
ncbi:1-deoxy-D-xylulose-5-phosphate synthase [Spiroplasma helicoides]|uniref:1-deoxy-D-xylulose-5-phosphate synthase n=1 Tax=Spiroplasma helicoides TaxID=216938 RepID=A0A1B3SKS1_9MOLU|nr:1-deoxy-D-xylulose-5-phosphate synthase N-terminal domain-containing protein [Spiroplasma helicoides]AOG60517.1 1-deoxy-D-xylulose-5-phosphate synthase [Spiroplasma helicoides]